MGEMWSKTCETQECSIGPELFTMYANEEGKATRLEIQPLHEGALVGPPGFYVLVGGSLAPPAPEKPEEPAAEEDAGPGPEEFAVRAHDRLQTSFLAGLRFLISSHRWRCVSQANLLEEQIQTAIGSLIPVRSSPFHGPLAGCFLALGSGLGLVGTVSARR